MEPIEIIVFLLLVIAVAGMVIAPFSPRIAMTDSRKRAFFTYLGATIVLLLVVGIFFITDLRSGRLAFENENWDRATEILSQIPPGHEDYDSAQALLSRIGPAREAAARGFSMTDLNYGLLVFKKGLRDEATETLSQIPPGHEDYDSAQALLSMTDLNYGRLVLENDNWDRAMEILSQIPPGHEDYDSAQALLSRTQLAREAAAVRDSIEQVRRQALAAQRERENAIREQQQAQEAIEENAWELELAAHVMCQTFVKRRLKSPSTADFPGGVAGTITERGTIVVTSHVDSQNSFGAMIRTNYVCEVRPQDPKGKNWTLVDLRVREN